MASKVKLPENERLAFAQYMALSDTDMLQSTIGRLKEQHHKGPIPLARLVRIADEMMLFDEGTPTIITEVQGWLETAKKTMAEDNPNFKEWQKVKSKYSY
jgi:hypothetical protein